MRVGSLFTGIGGLDLGLARAGFEIAWQVEIDPYCRKVLGQHWPGVKRYEDVRAVGAHNLIWTDVLVGGFPCQDISSAGKRAGIEGERSGLWREFARIIGELRPRYVLIENVAALLYANKTCNGERREAAIATVLRDLAAFGYDAQWRVFSAAEFGAPHLRKRVFIVAYLPCERGDTWRAEPAGQRGQTNTDQRGAADVEDAAGRGLKEQLYTTGPHAESDASGSAMADANGSQWRTSAERGNERNGPDTRWQEAPGGSSTLCEDGRERTMADAGGAGLEIGNGSGPESARPRATPDGCGGHQGDAESLLGGGAYGFPGRLDEIEQRWPAGPGEQQYAWEPPRVIQGRLHNRVARLKGLGNAALPQIAEAIGYAIRWHAQEVDNAQSAFGKVVFE